MADYIALISYKSVYLKNFRASTGPFVQNVIRLSDMARRDVFSFSMDSDTQVLCVIVGNSLSQFVHTCQPKIMWI